MVRIETLHSRYNGEYSRLSKNFITNRKERVLPSWTTCIYLCIIEDSDVLNTTFGCDPLE